MKNSEIEKKIRQAYSQLEAPDVLRDILFECDNGKGKEFVMEKKKMNLHKGLAFAAVILLAVTGIFGFNYYQSSYAVASTISLDVNPSIEIKMNRQERVLEVNALNEDAKIILGDMDFSGSSLDVAVNALIGSMIRNGYLSDLANSILISVESSDAVRNAELQKKLSDEISQIISSNSFEGAVLSQSVVNDDEIQKLADEYGITVGKAQLISRILSGNPLYTFESLASLSINELNLLKSSADDGSLTSSGQASDKQYIGEQKAKEIALTHVGLAEKDITKYEIELDYEMGMMVYEVEFYANGMEYDVDINAKTGEIVHSHSEVKSEPSHGQNNSSINSSSYIGEASAKKIALSDAGVSENQISQYWIEFDIDDGKAVYEIEFYANQCEYEYDIDALSGEILKAEKDNKSVSQTQSGTLIQEAQAKEIALKHAGFTANQISRFEISLDYENGIRVYEIEFYVEGYEYEYEINALSGEIIKFEKDRD